MSEWKEYRLGDIVTIIGGFAYKGEHIGHGEGLLLGMGCVSFKEKFLMSGARPYAGDCAERYYANPGDLVLATRQQSDNLPILGMPAIIPQELDGKKLIVGANLYRVSNNSDFSNKYLYWLLKSNAYVNHIASCKTGTTVSMITKSNVEDFVFKAPEKQERDRIVSVLSSLDDKIDLLNRENATLEALAETLFRHYFIENPDPTWKEGKLGDYVDISSGVSYKGDELGQSDVGMVTLKNFNRTGGFRMDGYKNFTGKYKSSQVLHIGDLVVAHTDITQEADVIGNPALVFANDRYKTITFSMDVAKVISKNNLFSNSTLYFLMRMSTFKDHCLGYANGSTVLHLSKKAIPEYEFLVPSDDIIESINNYTGKIIKKVFHNQKQIQILSAQRDMLLPRLMSGEVKVDGH